MKRRFNKDQLITVNRRRLNRRRRPRILKRRKTNKAYIRFERLIANFVRENLKDLQLQINERLLPRIESLAESEKQERITQVRDQSEGDTLQDIIEAIEAQFLGRFSQRFIRNNLQMFFSDLGIQFESDTARQFAEQNLSVAPTDRDIEVLENAVRTSTNNIKNIAENALNDIRNEVSAGVQGGERWETIAKRLTKPITGKNGTAFDKAFNRAKFIARNEVGTALGTINAERQTSSGIDMYVWQTAEDERVRTTHNNLGEATNAGVQGLYAWREGVVYRGEKIPVARDPNYNGGAPTIPGQPYNCRCVALPYIPELEDDDFDE